MGCDLDYYSVYEMHKLANLSSTPREQICPIKYGNFDIRASGRHLAQVMAQWTI
jgi:hypothetical protein